MFFHFMKLLSRKQRENGMGEGMEQYLKFRGKEPSIDALLENRGLK